MRNLVGAYIELRVTGDLTIADCRNRLGRCTGLYLEQLMQQPTASSSSTVAGYFFCTLHGIGWFQTTRNTSSVAPEAIHLTAIEVPGLTRSYVRTVERPARGVNGP